MKILSFDMDGTLVDPEFNELVWNYGIPRLYAKQKNIIFKEAKEYVASQYQLVGDKAVEWYDIKFWFARFGLPGSWKDLMSEFKERIRLYPEVPDVLDNLKRRYDLVLTSNSTREFIGVEIGACGLASHFSRVFSATSDFGQVKKTPGFFAHICDLLKIGPEEMMHVGDHFDFDYLVPKKFGIRAFYLDREGKTQGEFVIRDLKELEERLS